MSKPNGGFDMETLTKAFGVAAKGAEIGGTIYGAVAPKPGAPGGVFTGGQSLQPPTNGSWFTPIQTPQLDPLLGQFTR